MGVQTNAAYNYFKALGILMIAEFVKMEGSSTGDLVVSEPMKPKFGETREFRGESNGKLCPRKDPYSAQIKKGLRIENLAS